MHESHRQGAQLKKSATNEHTLHDPLYKMCSKIISGDVRTLLTTEELLTGEEKRESFGGARNAPCLDPGGHHRRIDTCHFF